MTTPLLHFVHGNSFPAGAYRQFLDALGADFDVRAFDMHGHDPAFPVSDGWPHLVDELIGQLEPYRQPAILVGHSLGGMLSVMAARRRPELVRCVVLLDAPIVDGWRAWLLRKAKTQGWGKHFSPARFSERRRNVWPDAAAAYQHFVSKPLFSGWAPGVLDDYLEFGLEPHPQGVQLRFSREVETAIYRGLPHEMGDVVRGGLALPVGFIAGTDSLELRQAGRAASRRLVGEHFVDIKGGHLFPMESPRLAARLTRAMIGRLLGHA
jgi:pimeloyl-ACP methyl ester carboxylesterase